MKKITLIRHGETHENVQGLYAGHIDARLTDNGRTQIRLLAERLRQHKFDHIFCSDLSRAILTAQAVADVHGLRLNVTPLLREKGGGIYESRPFEEYMQAFAESGLSRVQYTPPEGESLLAVRARAELFLREHIAPLPERASVLVVAHGGFNRMFLGVMLNQTAEEALEIPQDNTCMSIVELDGASGAKSVLLNCTSHLPRIAEPRDQAT